MIRFIKSYTLSRTEANYKDISHSELNEWSPADFNSNGLYESLKGLEFVRLYFDFDFHYSDSDITGNVNTIFSELDSIKEVFGRYYFAGYCCDKSLYESLPEKFQQCIELKLQDLGKPLSFHVTFPTTKIKQDDLFMILRKDSCFNNPIMQFRDYKVYKPMYKEQLLRHPYAPKYGGPEDEKAKAVNFDNLESDPPADRLIATPRGTEREVTREDWSKVFIADMEKMAKAAQSNTTKSSAAAIIPADVDDMYILLSNVLADSDFKHDAIIRDLPLYVPRNYYDPFMKVFKELYSQLPHNSPEDLDYMYKDMVSKGVCRGFCQVMSNILSSYYKLHDYSKIEHLDSLSPEKFDKVSADDKKLLEDYKSFMKSWYAIVKKYFDKYDYIHTRATEERLLQKREKLRAKGCELSNTYKRLYVRKILYMCNNQYLYKKNDYAVEHYGLDNKAFKLTLKKLYQLQKVNSEFNNNLKDFKSEQLLESSDGLIYPRYRDMNYDCCLTDAEFQHFCTMYKSTFRHQQCADLALKIMIQDIASGFHDNSSIIKFYYGTGGNNKDCETCIYENIIGTHDLVFKTHKYDILADEKNQQIVSSLYVQFNELPPITNREKFTEFINALKNFNESGFVRTRAMYKDFETIETNVRFQCNTNNTQVRDVLLENADTAIKRRFLVAERIHSDEHSDNLWLFCHDVNKCRALKMYIKTHAKELYTEKLSSRTIEQFYKDNADIYAIYTDSTRNDRINNLKEALVDSGCRKAKTNAASESHTTYTVNLVNWHRNYKQFDRKITATDFKSLVIGYLEYSSNPYILQDDNTWKRDSKKYVFKCQEFIDHLNQQDAELSGISLE